jgi:hypothetical protein
MPKTTSGCDRTYSTARVKNFLTAALLQRGFELPQELLLLGPQAHRRFHHDAAKQIAGGAAAHGAHAFFAHAKYAPRLRLARNLQNHFAVERRHLDRAAERGGCKGDGHLAG